MKEKVVAFLSALGIPNTAYDTFLDILVENIQHKILHETNTRLPMAEDLMHVAVYMVVGEYLRFKKVSGQLEGFDIEPAIKQIQEGDTNIQYAFGAGDITPEQRLDSLIAYLSGRSKELRQYRKLVW